MSTIQTVEVVVASPNKTCDNGHTQNLSPAAGQTSFSAAEQPGRPLSRLSSAGSRAASDSSRVFRAIQPVVVTPISQPTRFLIISLLIMANLIQFISNFVTISGGLTLSRALGRDTGPGKANWMAASYSLTQGAFVLITGRLGAIYGHQRLALIGLLLFAIFSFANGFCRNFESFVAVRALTGVGGGIFMPNAVTVLALMVPPGGSRNVLLGLFAASPPIGGLVGALLAGLCANSDNIWNWTGLFAAIAGSSVICFLLLMYLMPKEQPVDRDGKVDVVGACLGVGSLLLYNVAWNQAPSVGWSTPYEIAILTLSVALFCAFLAWEKFCATDPIMPLEVFRAPTFLAVILVVLFSYMAFGIALWYAISWQQDLRNLSVLQIGVNFVPFGLGSVGAVGVAAWMIPRVAAKWVMAVGVAVVLAASLLLATMPIDQSYWPQTFPAMILCGFCPDFVYLAAQVIASNIVGRKHQGVASSLVGTLNLYGVSLGLGFAGTIETELTKSSSLSSAETKVFGFRGALYFSAALAALGLFMDFALVKMPKSQREGWVDDDENEGNNETVIPSSAPIALHEGVVQRSIGRPSIGQERVV